MSHPFCVKLFNTCSSLSTINPYTGNKFRDTLFFYLSSGQRFPPLSARNVLRFLQRLCVCRALPRAFSIVFSVFQSFIVCVSLFFVLSFIAYGIFSFDCNFRVSSLLCFAGPRFKSFHFCSLLVLVFHLISLSCLSMSFVSFAFSFCLIAFAQWLVILS